MASSTSFPTDIEKFDVFISFRAEDTGDGFASSLCNALCRKKIRAAYCNDDHGELVPGWFSRAIQEAKLSVIVFSENFASSPRRLEELNRILQCRETNGQVVLPIFYNIDPSHIRKQQGSYGAAMAALEERFLDNPEKGEQWRNALRKAANLSGWCSTVAGSESELVDEIFKDILKKLYEISPSNDVKGLIGADKRIRRIESLLRMNSSDDAVCIVGISGVRGIGKTTLARAIFDKFASKFEGSHFLENVKDETDKCGLDQLQGEMFSALLKEKNVSTIDNLAIERLKSKKVLVVLDNVNEYDQFERLAGNRDRFCKGSKIIVTTRDEQVINNIEADGSYAVEGLNSDEALQLFCSIAFRGNKPGSEYVNLSKRIINHANGIPSDLKHLGHRLCSKSMEVWRSELRMQEEKSLNGNDREVSKWQSA